MSSEPLIVFTRTYDLLAWLLPKAQDFPKAYRMTVTQRLMDAALDFQEALFDAHAAAGKSRQNYLGRADAHLGKLRIYLRLANRWDWLSIGQYEHVSRMVDEIGRLLGGWIKQTRA